MYNSERLAHGHTLPVLRTYLDETIEKTFLFYRTMMQVSLLIWISFWHHPVGRCKPSRKAIVVSSFFHCHSSSFTESLVSSPSWMVGGGPEEGLLRGGGLTEEVGVGPKHRFPSRVRNGSSKTPPTVTPVPDDRTSLRVRIRVKVDEQSRALRWSNHTTVVHKNY